MQSLPAVNERGITVVIDVPNTNTILEVIARLALLHPVRVIVGGNRFDVHQLARIIRRHTVRLDETLERIQQARPFTCFQALTLLAETPSTMPLVALDILTIGIKLRDTIRKFLDCQTKIAYHRYSIVSSA